MFLFGNILFYSTMLLNEFITWILNKQGLDDLKRYAEFLAVKGLIKRNR